ncbi:response regulator transcription factor [Parathalassolituus penaei]|uniref:Response regulator transcription factor n=1 Tax=Parathalassolituus penaei TaxID=2997323 RepID=A0A9X3IRR4_9GAMM|nr:response regulator transcription factor [Parathalassolituus penaei]MCY0964505.1 response regulator transcription factor [Parathalassolituus penaei]
MNNDPSLSTIVLVVDDSPDSLGLLNQTLNAAGLTVLVALSGQQALAILQRITPDVILMDALMPGMDGFETCTRIKQQLPMVPVIFMTGLTDVEHVVKGFDAGGVDYVTKPIKAEEVLARIRVHSQNARLMLSAHNALDQAGQFLLCINQTGQLLWATPHVHGLVSQAEGEDSDLWLFLGQQLVNWLQQGPQPAPVWLEGFGSPVQAHFGGEHQNGQYLVRLETCSDEGKPEQLREKLGITRRESEVLYWLSYGKTNWEIAQILNMSPRTVNKHLELMFRKLGVDNRTAAAAMSIRILGDSAVDL